MGPGEDISPVDLRSLNPLNIDGCPLSGFGFLHRLIINLYISDLALNPGGKDFQRLSQCNSTRDDCSRCHCAESFHDEDPVNGQPEETIRGSLLHLFRKIGKDRDQWLDSLARSARNRKNGSLL